MKVLGDNALHVVEFGRRSPRTDSLRWYYQVVGYEDLILVCHERDYRAWSARPGIILVNSETINGDILCQQFPKAPARWNGRKDLVQITVRPDKQGTRGQGMRLSAAIEHFLGPPTVGTIED